MHHASGECRKCVTSFEPGNTCAIGNTSQVPCASGARAHTHTHTHTHTHKLTYIRVYSRNRNVVLVRVIE